jgi:hypothetical protein
MRERLIFEAKALFDPEPEDEYEEPPMLGKVALEYLAAHLPQKGLEVGDIGPEDWGWVLDIKNPELSLYIGCGFAGKGDFDLNCYFFPDKPRIWHLFGRQRKRERIRKIKNAVEEVLRESGKAHDLRWVVD